MPQMSPLLWGSAVLVVYSALLTLMVHMAKVKASTYVTCSMPTSPLTSFRW